MKKLSESQKFDFDFYKKRLKTIIGYAVNQKITEQAVLKHFQQIFYSIIRNDTIHRIDAHKTLGFLDFQVQNWNKYFSSNAWETSGPWSQRNFNQTFQRKSGKDKTYNYYITLEKSKDNIMKFWNFLPRLDRALKELSDTEQSPISYKTHKHLDYIVVDNDSLKVFYYDSNLKLKIDNIIKTWAATNKIKLAPRSHAHGVDIRFNPNEDKLSFGEIASKEIAKLFFKVITQHKNKYTENQYLEWIQKHFFEILSKIDIK